MSLHSEAAEAGEYQEICCGLKEVDVLIGQSRIIFLPPS